MKHLHYDLNLTSSDSVQVSLDKQANVMLLDSSNYQRYKKAQQFKYYGGRATHSPTYVSPPCAGHWHLVIDLGGYPGRVSAAVSIV